MPKIMERFSPLFNISIFSYMLKWNYLYVKRTNMYFYGLSYTRCYVKPAKVIWVSLSVSLCLSLSLLLRSFLFNLDALVKIWQLDHRQYINKLPYVTFDSHFKSL